MYPDCPAMIKAKQFCRLETPTKLIDIQCTNNDKELVSIFKRNVGNITTVYQTI